jgi:hypothetical protein
LTKYRNEFKDLKVKRLKVIYPIISALNPLPVTATATIWAIGLMGSEVFIWNICFACSYRSGGKSKNGLNLVPGPL